MESGSSAKPVAGQSPVMTPRTDVVASSKAVRTQLPPETTVQQVHPVENVRFEPSAGLERRAALDAVIRAELKRDTIIDPNTRDVVSQTLDVLTGHIVKQTPDIGLLRLRAYLKEKNENQQSNYIAKNI